MSLLNNIKKDQLEARKAKNAVKASLLTTLLGEVQIVGKNDGNRETTDVETISIIRKFIKNINETLTHLASKNEQTANLDEQSAETKDKFTQEKEILEVYLPQQMSEGQLLKVLSLQIAEGNLIQGASFKGQAMKYLKDNFAGTYDGKQASILIDSLKG